MYTDDKIILNYQRKIMQPIINILYLLNIQKYTVKACNWNPSVVVLIDRDFLCSTCLKHTPCATAHCVDKTIHSKLQIWYFKKLWLVSYLWNKYFPCDSIFSICITRVLMMTSSNGNFFPRYWPFVRIIHWSPMNSPHKGQWRGA